MKIFLVVFIAAVASARQPPRGFDIDYSDMPPFFDSPPFSRPSFLSPFSRHPSHPRVLKSFSDDDTSIIGDGPPSYRREKIIYSSLPPSSSYYPRRLQNFYKYGPSSFSQGLSIDDNYRGPPPPAPYEYPRKQMSVTRDERPGATSLQFQTTMAHEQESYKSAEQPIRQEIPSKQPLSFGGHSNYLSYGNHGLGFASVAGATAANLDPVAIAEMTMASRNLTNEVQVSQQQPVTYTPKPAETLSSSEPKVMSTASQSLTVATVTSSDDSKSTTPSTPTSPAPMASITPKTHLSSVQNSSSLTTKTATITMSKETPNKSSDLRTVTQELPAVAHGQLPLESPRLETSHVLDIKQNLLHDENKDNFPYQQFDYQFHQQNSNNAAPLKFTIPTAAFSDASLSAASAASIATVVPPKPVNQGLSFPQTPLALAAVPNSNTYSTGQNQIDISQIAQLSSINNGPQLPSYYYTQNAEQTRAAPQISSNIPLASFYMLPNNVQPRQSIQMNTDSSTGTPLQLSGFGGFEFLGSASNAEQLRLDILGIERARFNLQGQSQSQSAEPTYARINWI